MKLTIKNIKSVEFSIEVPNDTITILDLKKQIEKEQNHDATTLKLIYNGAVLQDDKTLQDYKIQEGFVLIMMTTKAKPKNVEQPKVEAPKEEPKNEPQNVPQNPPQNVPQNPPKQNPPQKPAENYTEKINSLMEMGFEKSQAEAAIKAAKGNVELAIEFLYSGIPENLPNLEGNFGEVSDVADNISNIQRTASIVKVICSRDPNALQAILANIQHSDPDLFNELKEKEEEFKNLISQPLTRQDIAIFQQFQQELHPGTGAQQPHQQPGQGQQNQNLIKLTKEEDEAIKRLMELGNFNKAEVVQTYFACDKNEEMAANILFEQKWNDDQNQGFQFQVDNQSQNNANQSNPQNPQNNNQPQNPPSDNNPQNNPQNPPENQGGQ